MIAAAFAMRALPSLMRLVDQVSDRRCGYAADVIYGTSDIGRTFFCLSSENQIGVLHRDELPLERLEIAYKIADLIRFQPELGHIWMAGHDAFTERFFERFDWITLVKFSKRRCQLERTFRHLID